LVLVDDESILREGLVAVMQQETDLEVVAEAPTVRAAEALEVDPDVVVSSLRLPDAAPVEVIERLRARFCGVPIVVLTALDDLVTVRQVIAAGANGYVLKSASTTELFAAIRAVARGGVYLQLSIGMAFASARPDEIRTADVGGLTPKETEVLRLLALGHTGIEIAKLLNTSLRTIETHRAHIHRRLDRHTRADLVHFALENGLLRLDGPTDCP
jgi:two-component system, NarL family, response regulator NreC